MDKEIKKEIVEEIKNMTPEQREKFADEVFPINLTPALPIFHNPKLFYANPRVGGDNNA